MIPLKTDNKEHKKIVKEIIFTFVEKQISKNKKNSFDPNVQNEFLKKFAYFVLSSPKEEIDDYLKPFLDNFNSIDTISDLFQQFIYAEDHLNMYENFWVIWDLFYPKIIELCKNKPADSKINSIVKGYLFDQIYWKENTTEWHTLKSRDKRFFKKISKEIGKCPSVLYAISKLLDNIGSPFLNDGIFWISTILKDNQNLLNEELETNTIYYLEKFSRKYIYENRENIRKDMKLKTQILIILDFLIEKRSYSSYSLRENIL